MGLETITLKGVYYLEAKEMNPIAIRPTITPNNYISWDDTGHGRMIRYASVFFDGKQVAAPFVDPQKLPQKIDIITDHGDFHLVKLTNKIFNEKLKKQAACGGRLEFKNDEEVQQYYLKTNFQG